MESLADPRFLRGLDIVRRGGVRQLRAHVWAVNSATHTGGYLVDLESAIPACTCPDFEGHGTMADFKCKHVFAALVHTKQLEVPAGMNHDEQLPRPTYRQDWPNYEKAQQHEREHFVTLLRDLCGGLLNPIQPRGRPRKPLADVVFAAVLRAYTGLSSRRATSDVRAAHEDGLIDEMISPKTLIRYLDDPTLTNILRALIRESASPLVNVEDRFAIDSSGFSTCTYSRWFDEKYGRTRKKQRWVKAHICVGVHTHIITDVIVTDSSGADSPQLPELVANTAGRFQIIEVSADKAYASFRNFDAIEGVGATPYIPFKIGTTGEGPALWRKMWALYMFKNDVFRRQYHARSNVETVFSMVKRKFGAAVRAKNDTAQRNEVLCKLLAHNLCVLVASMYELDVAAEFWGQADRGGPDVH
jgi:transposase